MKIKTMYFTLGTIAYIFMLSMMWGLIHMF